MKMKNKIFLSIAFLAGIFIFISCLKDDADYWKDEVAGKMYATVAVPTLQTMGLQPVAGEVSFSFMVNIATDALPTKDITVKLKVDGDAVTKYNTQSGKNFLLYPNLRIENPTITIAKGTRTATVNCTVWGAETLNACDNYIAAISIDEVSDNIPIASNMKSYLIALPIANPYAGDYTAVGYRKHPTLGMFYIGATAGASAVETAKTVNCSTIRKSGFGDYPYDMTIEVTTNTIVVQGVTCYKCIVHVIDPSTDAPVDGEKMYDTFTGDANAIPKPVTNDVNYYNPVTKTFVLNASYNASAPRIAYEVLTRK